MLDHTRDSYIYFPWIGTAIAVAYAVYVTIKLKNVNSKPKDWINCNVKKENDKVVDSFDIEDLDKKAVFCRCWKSKKFPYCDGSHNKHNESTQDNVGPLIIQRKGA